MAIAIFKTNIPREQGYLYFCKGDPITIYKAKMARGEKKKKEPTSEQTNEEADEEIVDE